MKPLGESIGNGVVLTFFGKTTSGITKLNHPLIPPTSCDTSQDSKDVSEERLFA